MCLRNNLSAYSVRRIGRPQYGNEILLCSLTAGSGVSRVKPSEVAMLMTRDTDIET